MMKYEKQPISIKEQIEKLRSRGLVFKNDSYAEKYLSNISYYRLRAYTYPFQDNDKEDQPFKIKINFLSKLLTYMYSIGSLGC